MHRDFNIYIKFRILEKIKATRNNTSERDCFVFEFQLIDNRKRCHSISDQVFCFVEPSEGTGDRRQPSFIKTWTQFHALSVRITTYQRTETIISFDV